MSITIVSPKIKQAEAIESTEIVKPEVVDEFAVAATKLAKAQDKLKPLVKKVGELEKGLIGAVDEVIDPSVKFVLMGNDYEVPLSAQGKRTELVDPEKAAFFLGDELFMKLAKVSVADLKAYLTPDQLEHVMKTSYKIKRRVKIEKL